MVTAEELLQPISESNPGGENLRYSPLMDKLKEARRQDDDAPQGEWQRERKVAAFRVRPLNRDEAMRYRDAWRRLQAQFVDEPKDAVLDAESSWLTLGIEK